MDKETLSHYGWIVILVLILSVLLALASPFGMFIADGFKATYAGLFDTGNTALNAGLSAVGIDTSAGPQITFDQEVSFVINSPISTTKTLYTLSGTVTDDSEIKSLSINDTNVTVEENGTWSTNITLTTDDVNEIVVVATNNKDKTTEKIIYLLVKLGPGLYDANDILLADWDTLVNTYGLDISRDYEYSDYENVPSSLYKVINGNSKFYSFGVKLVVGEGVTSIGKYAFHRCQKLTTVILPDSVTTINSRAFNGTMLINVSLGNGLTTIGGSAFMDCTKLKNIEIPNSVTSIGQTAFFNCKSIERIVIPGSVTNLGDDVFKMCSGLSSVVFEEGVTTISDGAFNYCDNLSSVIMADTITTIGERAFSSCNGFTSIGVNDGEADVVLSNSITKIGTSAFQSCDNLTSVTLPNSVTHIGNQVFAHCDTLKNVALPSSLIEVGYHAFDPCEQLTDITYNGTTYQWAKVKRNTGAFFNIPANYVQCTDGQGYIYKG